MTRFEHEQDEEHQNRVCDIVETKLKNRFRFEKDETVRQGFPDIVAIEKNNRESVELAFEATRFEKIWVPKIRRKKEKQVKRFNRIRPSFLVVPSQRLTLGSFFLWKNFYVISINWLEKFLDFILENIENLREEYYKIETSFSYARFFAQFLPEVLIDIHECKSCGQTLFPIKLLHCRQYDHYLHPDYLDLSETDDNKPPTETFVECDGCRVSELLWANYHNCELSEEITCIQCVDCGAIFNNELKVIKNFEDGHLDCLKTDFRYYEKLG